MMNVMKNKLIYVLFIGILLFPLFGYSQTFRGLSVSDGLSDLVVNALYKDSTGYVWIGTLRFFDSGHSTYSFLQNRKRQ